MSTTSDRTALRPLFMSTALMIAMMIALTGCAKKAKIAKPPKIGATETGVASWYGHPYHGRRAANGEIYDMEKLTAAHRTYPFDTWVRVRNLSNDRTVDVRIQDRGPFIGGRIIDLSHAAAREIELIGPGITKVKLTVIAPPKDLDKQPELFGIQVGAFREQPRALALQREMRTRFGTSRVIERGATPPMYRVVAGEYPTAEQAEAAAEEIRRAGGVGLVVRLDEPTLP
jgi:rare lipoprotein A